MLESGRIISSEIFILFYFEITVAGLSKFLASLNILEGRKFFYIYISISMQSYFWIIVPFLFSCACYKHLQPYFYHSSNFQVPIYSHYSSLNPDVKLYQPIPATRDVGIIKFLLRKSILSGAKFCHR